jgi:hypothetical protein
MQGSLLSRKPMQWQRRRMAKGLPAMAGNLLREQAQKLGGCSYPKY